MIRLLALALAAAIPAAVFAQPAPGPKPAPPVAADPDEIVVKGRRMREQELTHFVDALTPSRMRGQIVRHALPVCPATFGLTEPQTRAVTARLRTIAAAVAVPLAPAGCKPNLLVMVTDDRQVLARRIRAALSDRRLAPVALAPDPGKAIVLHFEGELDANRQLVGIKEESGDGPGGYGQVEVFTSDRIRPGTSPTFLASILVVEPATLDGLTTIQLADYAAMRLLAKTDPARVPASAPTILSILDAPLDTNVPITLTAWDLAFLKGLYASTDRSYASRQRGEIREQLRKDLERPR